MKIRIPRSEIRTWNSFTFFLRENGLLFDRYIEGDLYVFTVNEYDLLRAKYPTLDQPFVEFSHD